MIVRYHVAMAPQVSDPRWVCARLTKGWHRGPGHQTQQRLVAEVWVNRHGMNETETLAAVLHDLREAVLDTLA